MEHYLIIRNYEYTTPGQMNQCKTRPETLFEKAGQSAQIRADKQGPTSNRNPGKHEEINEYELIQYTPLDSHNSIDSRLKMLTQLLVGIAVGQASGGHLFDTSNIAANLTVHQQQELLDALCTFIQMSIHENAE